MPRVKTVRRTLLSYAAFMTTASSLLVCPASAIAARPERPNIVFILADDLGYTDLACYGSKYYETPNIDKLASQGMRFTDGHSGGPNCQPSRAALLSGRQLLSWYAVMFEFLSYAACDENLSHVTAEVYGGADRIWQDFVQLVPQSLALPPHRPSSGLPRVILNARRNVPPSSCWRTRTAPAPAPALVN